MPNIFHSLQNTSNKTEYLHNTLASSSRRLLTYPLYNYSATLAGGTIITTSGFINKGPQRWYRGIVPSLPFGIIKEFSQLTLIRKLNHYVPDNNNFKPLYQTGLACMVDGFFAPISAAINEVRLKKANTTYEALIQNPNLFYPSQNKALNIMLKGSSWWLGFTITNHILKSQSDTSFDTIWKGSIAGIIASTVCYPLDTVKFRSLRQTTYKKKAPSLIKLGKKLCKSRELYKGIRPCILSGLLSGPITALIIKN